MSRATMAIKMALLAALLAGTPAFFTAGAQAQQPDAIQGTLKKIRDQGAIYLGYREGEMPFSYADDQQNPQGYSWDLCGKIAAAIKEKLGLASLPVVPVMVTGSNRLMQLRGGSIDLECGNTANTPARQRQAAFTYTTYVSGIRGLVKADSSIRSVADLGGKRVVTTLGSSAERYVKTANALRGASIEFVVGDTHADSLSRVAAGKADVFVLDDVQLAVLKARSATPEAYRILDDNLAIESLAIALPKDDPAFKQLVDATLAQLIKSGEVEALYGKWFMAPLPGSGLNLQIPPSEPLKERLRNPADR